MVADRISQGSARASRVDPRECGPAPRMRLVGAWHTMAAALLVGGCGDGPVPVQPEPPASVPESPAIVSDPVSSISASIAGAGFAAARGAAVEIVYISLPPDSIPNGTIATIRSTRTGSTVTTVMVDGGFDPVPLAAAAGDSVVIDIQVGGGGSPVHTVLVVPAARKPRVVRVYPPHKKRDVPLNAQVQIVFSEPVDPATVTGETIRLQYPDDPTRVSGQLEFRDAERLTATFIPDAPLAAGADYQLVIAPAIRDLDGEALEAPVNVEFSTGSSTQAGPLTGQIGFVSWTWALRTMLADGSLARMVFSRVTHPTGWGRLSWSPDGARIAFGGDWDIYTVSPDGSGLTNLTNHPSEEYDPAWSPDGSTIVYAGTRDGPYADLYLMNADGSGLRRLTNDDSLRIEAYVANAQDQRPTWSPDGKKIAFERTMLGYVDETGWAWYWPQIWVVNVDGSGLARVTADWSTRQQWPAWSPDGSRIAFVAYHANCPGPGSCRGIWIMNADGSGATMLTPSGDNSDPAWTGDGRILFTRFLPVAPGAETSQIFIMNADGSGQRALSQPAGGNHGPAWGAARTP